MEKKDCKTIQFVNRLNSIEKKMENLPTDSKRKKIDSDSEYLYFVSPINFVQKAMKYKTPVQNNKKKKKHSRKKNL